jgi:hypothetical protein
VTLLIWVKSQSSVNDSRKSINSKRKTGSKLFSRASSATKRLRKGMMVPHQLTRRRQQSSIKRMMDSLVNRANALVEEATEANKLQKSR